MRLRVWSPAKLGPLLATVLTVGFLAWAVWDGWTLLAGFAFNNGEW